MGLTINLPTAGILSPPLVQTNMITEDTTLEANRVYVLNPTDVIGLTLPTTGLNDGDSILLKNITTPNIQVNVNTARIEGRDQEINITDNTPVRLIWTVITQDNNNSAFGWLVA